MDNYLERELPDGRWIDVVPLAFGRARIAITSQYSRYTYDNVF